MPAAITAATQWPASSIGGEPDQQRARRQGLGQDAHGHLGDDAQEPLGPGHHAQEIIALGIEMPAAEADDLAIDQHQLDAEEVVGGEPVFEAMHAARILGDIAADGAGDLARRVGRVIKAGLLDRLGQRQVGDPGLGHDAAIVVIDVEDAVELGHAEQYAVGQRQGPARQRGAGAARHDLDAQILAIAQHRRDLFDPRRQHDDQRQLAIGGQPVALIGPPLGLGDDDALARHDPAQRLDDLGAALQHRRIGSRHLHRRSSRRGGAGAAARLCLSPGAPCSGGWSC